MNYIFSDYISKAFTEYEKYLDADNVYEHLKEISNFKDKSDINAIIYMNEIIGIIRRLISEKDLIIEDYKQLYSHIKEYAYKRINDKI